MSNCRSKVKRTRCDNDPTSVGQSGRAIENNSKVNPGLEGLSRWSTFRVGGVHYEGTRLWRGVYQLRWYVLLHLLLRADLPTKVMLRVMQPGEPGHDLTKMENREFILIVRCRYPHVHTTYTRPYLVRSPASILTSQSGIQSS